MTPLTDRNQRELIAYWSMAGTPHGRAWINARRHFKCLVWRSVIASSLALKRTLDILVALLTLTIWSPFLLLVIALIKLEDRGPIFFRQKRIGLRGQPFGMWKFRSMVMNADKIKDALLQQNEMAGGVTFKMKNDPRVTRIGKWIRKFSVDEVPQLWNVLVGDMSVVGPRPSPHGENQYCPAWREARLSVRPGITGLWQVQRTRRAGSDFQEWIKYDIEYVERRTIWLDLVILWKTVANVFGKLSRN